MPKSRQVTGWRRALWWLAPFAVTVLVWLYQIPYAHRMAVNQTGGNYDHTAVFFVGLLALVALHVRLIITDRQKIFAIIYPILNVFALVLGSMYFYFAAGGPE